MHSIYEQGHILRIKGHDKGRYGRSCSIHRVLKIKTQINTRESVQVIVNVIHCNLPKGKAAASTTKEDDVYIITVQRTLTGDELRKELKHELSHIVNGDKGRRKPVR